MHAGCMRNFIFIILLRFVPADLNGGDVKKCGHGQRNAHASYQHGDHEEIEWPQPVASAHPLGTGIPLDLCFFHILHG